MCGSMVDIQSAAAEIRRAIKKIDRKKPQGKNIMSASATQGGHNKHPFIFCYWWNTRSSAIDLSLFESCLVILHNCIKKLAADEKTINCIHRGRKDFMRTHKSYILCRQYKGTDIKRKAATCLFLQFGLRWLLMTNRWIKTIVIILFSMCIIVVERNSETNIIWRTSPFTGRIQRHNGFFRNPLWQRRCILYDSTNNQSWIRGIHTNRYANKRN